MQWEKLNPARAAVDEAVAHLEKSVPAGQSLLTLYEIEVDRDIEAALRTHEKLFQQIPKASGSADEQRKVPDYLAGMRQTLADAAARIPKLRSTALPEDLQNDLSRIDRQYLTRLKGLDGKDRRQYQGMPRCSRPWAGNSPRAGRARRPPWTRSAVRRGGRPADQRVGRGALPRCPPRPRWSATVCNRCALGKTLAEWAAAPAVRPGGRRAGGRADGRRGVHRAGARAAATPAAGSPAQVPGHRDGQAAGG